MIYEHRLYISNDIKKSDDPALPAVHDFERWKFYEYQPVQGGNIIIKNKSEESKKMICYHGTSYNNFISMITGRECSRKNWEDSDSSKLYLWSEKSEDPLERAYNSAIHCAAVQNDKSDRVIVMELNIPDEYIENTNNSFIGYIECTIKTLIDIRKYISKIHYFRYIPENRARYLYNQYHNCGGTRWESIEDIIVDKEDLIIDLQKLEQEYEYEYWFEEYYLKYNLI